MTVAIDQSEFRILRRGYLVSLLLFIAFPFVGLAAVLLLGESIGMYLVFGYMIGYLFWGLHVFNAQCPRCRNNFFRRGIFYTCFPYCTHCKLSLFKERMCN